MNPIKWNITLFSLLLVSILIFIPLFSFAQNFGGFGTNSFGGFDTNDFGVFDGFDFGVFDTNDFGDFGVSDQGDISHPFFEDNFQPFGD